MSRPPEPAVRAAFGVAGEPVALEGRQGSSWRVGDLVLKPLDQSEEMLATSFLTDWARAPRRAPG
jgi:hypothetical protein